MEPVDDPRLYSNRYQVTHLIARGGMAIVYRAQDTLLNRAVALKILYPELSEDPLFVERFRREAQAAANLSHPNIVPVFDWGEDGGAYFIVMELVDGTSLAEMLRGGVTLTPARSAQIVAQVAAALGYAHRSGVVHRDVKPGNILITRDGQVKVTDFGIAQAVSSEDHLAEAGSVMGTATYFSPEQAEGAAVDGRSDVYSLGVVLYEMLVGRPPFIGDTPVEVSSQHVRSTVPALSQFSSSVPHDLEAIVMEALSKSPSNRYQSADELRADLIRFSEGQPVHAAMRDTAFFGEDATRAVAAVAGERTRSVPIMTGPRTDVRRRRGISYSGISFVVVVLLVAVGVVFFFEHNKSTTTAMPNLVGQQLKAAKKTLKNDDIGVEQVIERQSKKPSGSIISTNPSAGTVVTKGDSVTIIESEGITTVTETVQDVVNQGVTDAESTLSAEKLGVKIDQVPTAPPGTSAIPNTVLAQSPVAGTKVQSGTTVILTVLKSGAQYDLESVNGETQYAAGATLATQGITVSGVTRVCSNTVNPGLVIGTLPPAGSLVKEAEAIQLQVSTGPCNVLMPSVVNDTEAQADTALQQQGLTASYTPDLTAVCQPGAAPTVASQSNAPGTNVKYGTTVDLTICQTTADTTTTTAPTTTSS